ncbi:ABC transporter permease [Streptomyces sp. NPDC026673]|uniref:ABC transporter permease n=1 Tax=Streptomyces sp. NPDC026673 TaxID=3155724 RepID=UPI0033E090BF
MRSSLTALDPHRASPSPGLMRTLVRLHRPALYGWTVLVLGLSALLLWLGGPLTDASVEAWRQFDACLSPTCSYDQAAIIRYKHIYLYATFATFVVPVLVAACAGAALTARDPENGTAKVASAQGVSPARWLAVKLTVPAVAVAAGTGLLVLLHHLMWSASQGRIDSVKAWYDTPTFYTNGPVLVALALVGLAAGALAGMVRRRSIAALATAPLAVALIWAALHAVLPRLWPTVTSVCNLDDGNGLAGDGITVGQGFLTSTGSRHPFTTDCGPYADFPECRRTVYNKLDATSFYHEYHPATHYWPLQLTATAILLAATALKSDRTRGRSAAARGRPRGPAEGRSHGAGRTGRPQPGASARQGQGPQGPCPDTRYL